MKKIFKKLFQVLSCLLIITPVHAYKYVIFTDDTKTDKAKEVAELIQTTYPFSTFDIEVEIVKLQPRELDCGSKYGIDRLVVCKNMDEIQAKTMMADGDQAMIIKDTQKYGGSSTAGGIPTITTVVSAKGMLHEYMHTLGLCDEYKYPASEAGVYCGRGNRPNLVFIKPLDPYAEDSMARRKHMSEITWSKDIIPTTPITNSTGTRLGTGDVDFSNKAPFNTTDIPQVLSEPTGLYRGKICNNAVPEKVSWHPGATATIMENTNAGLGAPLEKIVEKLMISKGVKKKLQYVDEAVNVGSDSDSDEDEIITGRTIPHQKAIAKINDTARALFKSFFSWGRDIVDKIKKVLSI